MRPLPKLPWTLWRMLTAFPQRSTTHRHVVSPREGPERRRFGEAGAVLVRPGARRVHCYCVKPTEVALPRADRIAHLLLALRADESGFATLANVAFCGARWRLRRRLGEPGRVGLEAAAGLARTR